MNAVRECPFCDRGGASSRVFGRRHGMVFLRCPECRAVFMNLSPAEFRRLHDASFEDDVFIENIQAALQATPDHRAWQEIEPVLGAGSILELGSGTGHLLAAARAAGREVASVESSARHRDFMRQTWGFTELFSTFDELPAGRQYDNAVMVNVLEHVYDVAQLMHDLRAHLRPGARVYISTVNANGIVGSIAGTYWSMFKPEDHVSFPSGKSLDVLASRTGYQLEKRWSGELPLETPVGLLVAARDYLRDARGKRAGAVNASASAPSSTPPKRSRLAQKRLVAALFRAAERVDPSRHVIASFERAASVKGLFVRT